MKFAKKMRLVEIDNDFSNDHSMNQSKLNSDDEKYTQPKVLSTLDKMMDEILRQNGLCDADKWTLYNQVLRRYLVNVKNKKDASILDFSKCNNILESTRNSHDVRDSLDSISEPAVRSFFEKARERGQGDILNESISFRTLSTPSRNSEQDTSRNDSNTSRMSFDANPVEPEPEKVKKITRKRKLTYPNSMSLSQFDKTRLKTVEKRQAEKYTNVTKRKIPRIMPEWSPVTYH